MIQPMIQAAESTSQMRNKPRRQLSGFVSPFFAAKRRGMLYGGMAAGSGGAWSDSPDMWRAPADDSTGRRYPGKGPFAARLLISPYPRAHEALHELALEQQESDEQRRRRHQGGGADHRPFDALVGRGEHLQPDRDRARLDRVGDDQRPEELVHEVARERRGAPGGAEVLERERRERIEPRREFRRMERGPHRIGERQYPQEREQPRARRLEREPGPARRVGRAHR